MTPSARTPIAMGTISLAVLLTACSATPAASPNLSADISDSPSPSASSSPSLSPTPSPSPSPVVLNGAASAVILDRTIVLDDLDLPWDAAWTPDGTLLVTMRDEARILRYKDGEAGYLGWAGAEWLKSNTDIRGEGGLLGIALLPSNPNVVYLYVTRGDGNAVVRMSWAGQTLGAPKAIVTGIPKNTYHDGGRIRFGPDGYLYITTGDAGNRYLAQDRNSLAGKILRVVANGTDEDGSPAPGNPFGTLVWTYGHRNPQGIGWAADGRMFSSELGWNTQDELNLIEPGNNYGWPNKEGFVGAPSGTKPGQTVSGYTYPLVTWKTSEASPSGIAVTDEAVYMGALRGQRVWRIPLTPGGVGTPHVLLNDLGRIRLVTQGPYDRLYLLTSNTAGGNQPVGVDQIVSIAVAEVD